MSATAEITRRPYGSRDYSHRTFRVTWLDDQRCTRTGDYKALWMSHVEKNLRKRNGFVRIVSCQEVWA